jgi:hypothetical protein
LLRPFNYVTREGTVRELRGRLGGTWGE